MSARPEDVFDWRAPDYTAIFRARLERLSWLRDSPHLQPGIWSYYKDHPIDFINDWGVTIDPRNISAARPAYLPFILMPKQRELAAWVIERWQKSQSGIIEKSRDAGASFLAMALAVTLCIFNRDMMIGVGSAKEDKIDRSGDPDTLFYKLRVFLDNLPAEFRPRYDTAHMRIAFTNGSSITGEAGDNIGRGGRKSIFFVDESAALARPLLVDAALIATTDCRIDISSVSLDGMANHFAIRRHSGQVPVFTMHWRDDKRRDEAWADAKRASTDPIVWAAEYDLNYLAAAEGVIIPQEWVKAAIDAHIKLGVTPSGTRRGALDVADQGRDLNCFSARHGILLFHCETWSGKGSDIYETSARAINLALDLRLTEGFLADADGLGAGVRGDARKINDQRKREGARPVPVSEFRGSAGVLDPERKVPGTDRTNQDMFHNMAAQSAWRLRRLFQNTFRAVTGDKKDYDPDSIISIDSRIPDLQKLCNELSQPQWAMSDSGKLKVQKTPDGALSPNRFDSARMLWSAAKGGLRIAAGVADYEAMM